MGNKFVKEVFVENARTLNGAKSYSTVGTELLDQFSKGGTYMGRDKDDVYLDQSRLWYENPENALRFAFYLRMITRKVKYTTSYNYRKDKTETVQRGQGLIDESLKRICWIALMHPLEFSKNLWVLPIVGSWKDLFTIMYMEPEINRLMIFDFIAEHLATEENVDLIKKFMPAIQSKNKCRTERALAMHQIALEFASYLSLTPKKYRKLKASGTAHEFQQLISTRNYEDINFNKVPGKALIKLAESKFLRNSGLEDSYVNWVLGKEDVNFNGYPYELGLRVRKMIDSRKRNRVLEMTVNKQFERLIKTGSDNNGSIRGNVLCALDTSGSMALSPLNKQNVTAYDICISLGIYFSTLNTGTFHKKVVMFDDTSRLLQLSGNFCDMYKKIISAKTAWGSTNFLSVVNLLAETRIMHPEIPLEDYPTTLLVVSDMQFNGNRLNAVTTEAVREILKKYFPESWVKELKLVWWNVNGKLNDDYVTNVENEGDFIYSGFDGAIISTLLGGDVDESPETAENSPRKEKTMQEVAEEALSQEVLLKLIA